MAQTHNSRRCLENGSCGEVHAAGYDTPGDAYWGGVTRPLFSSGRGWRAESGGESAIESTRWTRCVVKFWLPEQTGREQPPCGAAQAVTGRRAIRCIGEPRCGLRVKSGTECIRVYEGNGDRVSPGKRGVGGSKNGIVVHKWNHVGRNYRNMKVNIVPQPSPRPRATSSSYIITAGTRARHVVITNRCSALRASRVDSGRTD
jgi:hypothetical protein